jgi:transcription elongation factor Elf1
MRIDDALSYLEFGDPCSSDFDVALNAVIDALKAQEQKCRECGEKTSKAIQELQAKLKAQEPVKPKWRNGYAYCGQCGYKLHWIVDRNNFCANCGQAVKWE